MLDAGFIAGATSNRYIIQAGMWCTIKQVKDMQTLEVVGVGIGCAPHSLEVGGY